MDQRLMTSLQTLHGSNQDYARMLDYFHERKRNQEITTVDRLEFLFPDIARLRIVSFFEELEKLGIGKYWRARSHMPSRFLWQVPLTRVAAYAKGLEIPEVLKAKVAPSPAPPAQTVFVAPIDSVTVSKALMIEIVKTAVKTAIEELTESIPETNATSPTHTEDVQTPITVSSRKQVPSDHDGEAEKPKRGRPKIRRR